MCVILMLWKSSTVDILNAHVRLSIPQHPAHLDVPAEFMRAWLLRLGLGEWHRVPPELEELRRVPLGLGE